MNKKIFTREEIEEFYKNCPDDMEVLETRVFDVDLMRYIVVDLEYIF